MKRLLLFIYLGSFLALSNILNAQNETIYPSQIITPIHFDVSSPLKDVKIIPPGERLSVWEDNEIENKFDFNEKFKNQPPFQGMDPVLQDSQGNMKSPESIIQNFDGMPNSCNCAPPDTDGDVGPNHYFQMANLSFQIFNKSGTSLYGPAANQTLWEGFDNGTPFDNHNDGDPVILYDQYADRWVASQFALNFTTNQFYELIAVSATPDPLGAWYRYAFQFTNFPDYPKLGVWRDGYYLSINQFNAAGSAFLGAGAAVLNRDAMIAGNPTASMVFFNLGVNYAGLLPSDADGNNLPPSGAPGYFTEMDLNVLRVWSLIVDWAVPANSTLTLTSSLPTAAFTLLDYTQRIPQPGTSVALDNLGDRLMFRTQYRNFGSYQTMVLNHTVNAGSARAGIRWYELRNTGSGWTIYQQGTYAPADGFHRWMASIAMNANGDIALGYSVSSSALNPSIRYTARLASDPLGTMTLAEQSIFAGTFSQTGPTRWGDYSAMTVDPVDDYTFWYTNEYSTGGWNWRTRIASFQFGITIPVTAFTASNTSPAISSTVTFTDQSAGFPTSWLWSFNPSTITYVGGTSSTSQNPQVQFNALGYYTVTLIATNALGSDSETKTNYINVVPFVYCIPPYTSGTGFGDYISLVQLGSINNATGASASPYYTYYSTLSTNLIPNTAYTITLSPGTYASGNYIAVWIDYNQNGVFDTTEKLGTVLIPPTPTTGTINFTVPSTATSGTTRMRVREVYATADFDPCASYTYGETEDYNVFIQGTNITVDLTAFLEGPFNGATMTQGLAGLVPLNQPYNTSPWNYTGSESVVSIPANAIDWVLIELRNATTAGGATSGTRIGRKAAFLRNDGRIVNLDGTLNLNFGPLSVTNSLFVIVHHRNHVSVLSATGVIQTGGIYTYNFTTASGQAYGGTLAHKLIGSGVWGLFGGNSDGNGLVDSNDEDPAWENQAGTKGYLKSDFNFDTQSNNKDKDNIWAPNLGKGNQVPN